MLIGTIHMKFRLCQPLLTALSAPSLCGLFCVPLRLQPPSKPWGATKKLGLTLTAHQLSELHLCSCHSSLYCSVWYIQNPRGFARRQPFQCPQLKCPAQRRGELLR